MTLNNITGLVGLAFALAILIMHVFKMTKQSFRLSKWVYLVLLMFVLLLPLINHLSLAGYGRGYFGDLSITSLVLLSSLLWKPSRSYHRQHLSAIVWIAISALIFYPLALGWGIFDPYRLGFGHLGFILSLLCLTLWCVYRHESLIAFCIMLAILAWTVRWYESDNLWDYLLDPWLSVYAIGLLAKRIFSFIILKTRTPAKISS